MRRPTWSWYISLLSGPVFLPFHRALSCFAAAFVQTAQNQLVAKQVVDAGAEEELLEEEAAVRTSLRRVTQDIVDILEELKYEIEE
eukprot:m.71762 g.71762  ORF g.71762 m.71762 type:complete len:86 (-) comp50207_c0_seq2:22-279(-)